MSCDWYESSVLWNNLIGCQILVRDTVTWHVLLSHDLSRECQQFCNRKYKYDRGRNSCNDVIDSQSREGDMLQWRYIASSDPIWFVRSHSGYLETKFRIFFPKSIFPQWIVSEVEMFAIVANMCHRLKYDNFKSLPHKDTTSVNSKFHLPFASTNQISDKISNFDCSITKKNDFSVFTFLVMVDKLERVENNFIFVSHPNDVIIWLWKYDSLTNEIKFIPFPLSGSRTISLVVLFGQWKHANWSCVWDVSKAIRPNV